jgi:hypothetical protein
MISGTTSFWGTTGVFSVKNENAQTRNVITEKYKKPKELTFTSIELTGLTGGTLVYGSACYSGTTTINFFADTYNR